MQTTTKKGQKKYYYSKEKAAQPLGQPSTHYYKSLAQNTA